MKQTFYTLLAMTIILTTACSNKPLPQDNGVSPKVTSIISQIKAGQDKDALNAIVALDNPEYQELSGYFKQVGIGEMLAIMHLTT